MSDAQEWMTKCMNTPIDYIRFQKEMLHKEPVYIKGYGNDFGPYYIEEYRVYTDYRYNTHKVRYVLKDSKSGEIRTCLESELCNEKEHFDRLQTFRVRANSCYGLFGTTIMDDCAFDTTRYREFLDNLREGLGKHTTGGKKMLLREKKIIFSGPCTIILWEDGTKTMARVSEGETFDTEKGVAICFMKKILGHTEANKILRKAHKQYDKEMWEVKNEQT